MSHATTTAMFLSQAPPPPTFFLPQQPAAPPSPGSSPSSSIVPTVAAGAPTVGPVVKDSRWLTLEICREHLKNKCQRSDGECKYAHPPRCHSLEIHNGRVICCYDYIKGKCNRKSPPCKYLHPPGHLKEQLLQNGRNNLIIKNLYSNLLRKQISTNSVTAAAIAASNNAASIYGSYSSPVQINVANIYQNLQQTTNYASSSMSSDVGTTPILPLLYPHLFTAASSGATSAGNGDTNCGLQLAQSGCGGNGALLESLLSPAFLPPHSAGPFLLQTPFFSQLPPLSLTLAGGQQQLETDPYHGGGGLLLSHLGQI